MMGKPSSTRLPKRQLSEESIPKKESQMSGIRKVPINFQKLEGQNKKRKRRANKKIKKLIGQLKNQSNITIDSSVDSSSVLILDDTVLEFDSNASPNRKRKMSETSIEVNNKCMKVNDSESVIITDDVELIENRPISPKSNDNVNTDQLPEDTNVNNEDSIIKKGDIIKVNHDHPEEIDTIANDVPCSSMTPKKQFAPPINCSTPISIANTSNNNAEMAQKNINVHTNETKEINRDSFLTIDLTTETDPNRSSVSKTQFDTVIDLENTQDSQDCTFVSISNASLSMSGDSDVTVVRNNSRKRVNRFVNGIAKLDASEKGKLLELITQNIFNGCKIPQRMSRKIAKMGEACSKSTETVENSYIKEVILGQKPSRNSIGSNIYNPGQDAKNKTGLRMIVIDGSNVAMEHGKGRMFSVRGLQICIDYFLKRGHVVKAFVPRFRCKFGKSTDPRALDDLERRGLVVYTPSREVQGRTITPYDDRYIVQCAAEFDGIIVSGDQYRDLHRENPRWRSVIENKVLPFTWVNDMIMFPRDPLGRNGPTLDAFLRHPTVDPVPSIVL